MQPLEDVLTESNGPRVAESDYFSRPPQRSYQFIAATISMLVAIAIGSSILVRHWNELQTMAIMFMGAVAASTMILWLRAYQIFQRLHELYSQAKLDPSFIRSPTDKVFRSAGDLMAAVLFGAFVAAAYFFFALAAALSHHSAF
jgi:hypothetical protein